MATVITTPGTAYARAWVLLIVAVAACSPPAENDEPFRTEWNVVSAQGMDALLLLGAVAGDTMQADIYADEIAFVRQRLEPAVLSELDALGSNLRAGGLLVGPALAHAFSAGPIDTIDDVIASAADPVGRLRPGLELSPHWDEQEFQGALEIMPIIERGLIALRDVGYESWYADGYGAAVSASIGRNLAAVEGYDIVPEQERLLGRPLESRIDIVIVAFAKPYGIRILGQRFVAYHGWDADIQLRVAAHELFHPPFDPNDEELGVLLRELESDRWMQSIVDNHDPKYGYNSFMAVVDEGAAQALDQIVAERLGFAEDAGERWRTSDGGMHMLAAALYRAMKDDGFARSGGRFADWLKAALRRGRLAPEAVRTSAARVVGSDAVERWYRQPND